MTCKAFSFADIRKIALEYPDEEIREAIISGIAKGMSKRCRGQIELLRTKLRAAEGSEHQEKIKEKNEGEEKGTERLSPAE